MYADDLIILSTSTKGLQDSLDKLNNYCFKWKLKINNKKTKCISFTKGTQKEKHNFKIDHKIIDNVKEIKYLGITINRKKLLIHPYIGRPQLQSYQGTVCHLLQGSNKKGFNKNYI